jgi:hypothetical protein
VAGQVLLDHDIGVVGRARAKVQIGQVVRLKKVGAGAVQKAGLLVLVERSMAPP